jgi:hypothetical protein
VREISELKKALSRTRQELQRTRDTNRSSSDEVRQTDMTDMTDPDINNESGPEVPIVQHRYKHCVKETNVNAGGQTDRNADRRQETD